MIMIDSCGTVHISFMSMFSMDAHGPSLQHAVPAGTTVYAAYYHKVRFSIWYALFVYSTRLFINMLFFGFKYILL